MTNATSVIRQKEIHSIVDEYSSIPWYSLDRVLQKLDDEDLKDLFIILRDMEDALLQQSADEVSAAYERGYQYAAERV